MEVGGESGGWIWGGGRREETSSGREFMEMDLAILEVGCVIEPEFGLAEVGGGGGVVSWDVVGGGDEAGEVEELIEMALRALEMAPLVPPLQLVWRYY
ncbi:hypothetical protein RHSIM_Rhsim09G0032800 [Rhododendron simsii]|uniref:Uncharacterized protein n=1 Tax=Rhododendron simsii TaxID=118357 RepID=A0A834GHL7_RHOSS|nr:hypothetical protein RHSIM_Rhsim09G0032800 [Rhododendron simsii]